MQFALADKRPVAHARNEALGSAFIFPLSAFV